MQSFSYYDVIIAFYQVIPDTFWSEELFSLLLSCIMDPASLGFDMSDVEIVTKLPEQVRRDLRY